jgi:hypothetical protein
VDIRASDDDRQKVVAALERHTGAGRLTLDEIAERVQVAHDARTLGELAEVTRDLPAEPPVSASGSASGEENPRRELLVIFGVAFLALILLALYIALR